MEFVACDLCGSSQANIAFQLPDFSFGETGEEFSVVRCEKCHLLYLNPRPTESEISKYYPVSYFPTRSSVSEIEKSPEPSSKKALSKTKRWLLEDYYGYPSQESRSIWRIIRKGLLFPDWAQRSLRGKDVIPYRGGGRILDVGCGPGVNLESLQRFGWDVYGLDFSDVAIAEARRKFGDRIYSGTLDEVCLEDESFDVVMFSHSLEHMFSPAKALARARQLLKPQGMVIVTLPNAKSVEASLFWAVVVSVGNS